MPKPIKTPKMAYAIHMCSNYWLEISKQLRLEREKCELCQSTHALQIHHMRYGNMITKEHIKENQENHLLCVCHKCHVLIHKNSMFFAINPKLNKNTVIRKEFLKDFQLYQNLIKQSLDKNS